MMRHCARAGKAVVLRCRMISDMTRRTKHSRTGVPAPSSEAARNRMLAAKPRDTKPEVALRLALDKLGLTTYVIDQRLIPGLRRRADVVFEVAQVVIFVDGCFWHGCPIHGTWPKQNAEFWRDKIEANRRRDADTDRVLAEAGWVVIRAWEHEDPVAAAERVAEMIHIRQPQFSHGTSSSEP